MRVGKEVCHCSLDAHGQGGLPLLPRCAWARRSAAALLMRTGKEVCAQKIIFIFCQKMKKMETFLVCVCLFLQYLLQSCSRGIPPDCRTLHCMIHCGDRTGSGAGEGASGRKRNDGAEKERTREGGRQRERGSIEHTFSATHLSRASKLLARKNSHCTSPSKALASAESLPFASPGPRLSLQALPSGFPFLDLPRFLRSLSH
jgi:hypothetical protein